MSNCTIVAVLCIFLPDRPGKYDPKARQKTADVVSEVATPEPLEII